jgi:hypothetical protein
MGRPHDDGVVDLFAVLDATVDAVLEESEPPRANDRLRTFHDWISALTGLAGCCRPRSSSTACRNVVPRPLPTNTGAIPTPRSTISSSGSTPGTKASPPTQ